MEKSKKLAFSLAELMITLLILSIVLSAVMPAVTKRNTASESIWRWTPDNSASAYFGIGKYQSALIGLPKKPEENGTSISDFEYTHTAEEYMSLTSNGDRLMLMKSQIGANQMSNSHITFFTNTAEGTDPHYAGRLALDNTNIALGKYTMAGINNTNNAINNLAIGHNALRRLTEGFNNTAIGHEALYSNLKGLRNTALGYQTLSQNTGDPSDQTLGSENNALGYQAMFYNTTGYENNAVGHQAMFGNTTGYMNTAIGNYALKLPVSTGASDPVSGTVNTAVGYGALFSGAKANGNTAVGAGSGWSTTGSENTFIGLYSGYKNTEGAYNTYVGAESGYYTTTGGNNTLIGYKSGYNSTEGINNIFIGSETGLANTTGSNNTYLGTNAGKQHKGSSNVFLGAGAGYGAENASGGQNTFVGNNSGYATSSSEHNAFLGYDSGAATTSGGQNTFIGSAAGSANTTGSNNVYIGYNAGASNAAGTSDALVIGNGHSDLITGTFNSEVANTVLNLKASTLNIGPDGSPYINITSSGFVLSSPATFQDVTTHENNIIMNQKNIINAGEITSGNVKAIDTVQAANIKAGTDITTSQLHATTVYATTIYGTVAGASDRRLKNITGDAEKGLSAVDAFRIVKFNYKNDEKKTEHVGVIAQELQEVMPNAVVTREDGFLAITLSDITFTIAKALQELHEAVLGIAKDLKALTVKVTTNSGKIEALEKENKALKQQINDLDARLKKLEAAK